MRQTVDSDKTLSVDGPASVQLFSGKVEVFGYQLKQANKVLVREGKRLPFFAVEKAVLDISLGANAATSEVAGSTIPPSWNKPLEKILSIQNKPVTILVLGKTDSGKSSFCTYLVNKLVNEKCRVAVLDGDLGQSDIGPSGTVGYGLTSKPIIGLYELKLENAFFVGVTSPILDATKTIEGLTHLKSEISARPTDFLVVNTDGWVTDDIAVEYKTTLIAALKPDFIVAVHVENELEALIAKIEETPVVKVVSPISLSERSAEKRKSLREMTYARYLKDAKLHCYPLSQLTVEPRTAVPKCQEPEKGLLVGLYGSGSKFLGIGVLRGINPVRKVLKVQTAVSAKPLKLVFGKVVLNEKLQEVQD